MISVRSENIQNGEQVIVKKESGVSSSQALLDRIQENINNGPNDVVIESAIPSSAYTVRKKLNNK